MPGKSIFYYLIATWYYNTISFVSTKSWKDHSTINTYIERNSFHFNFLTCRESINNIY
jgi:hypothetical protein